MTENENGIDDITENTEDDVFETVKVGEAPELSESLEGEDTEEEDNKEEEPEKESKEESEKEAEEEAKTGSEDSEESDREDNKSDDEASEEEEEEKARELLLAIKNRSSEEDDDTAKIGDISIPSEDGEDADKIEKTALEIPEEKSEEEKIELKVSTDPASEKKEDEKDYDKIKAALNNEFETEADFTADDFIAAGEKPANLKTITEDGSGETDTEKEKKRRLGPIIFLSFVGLVVIFAAWFIGTSSGRRFQFRLIAKYVHSSLSSASDDKTDSGSTGTDASNVTEKGDKAATEDQGTLPVEDEEVEPKPELNPNYQHTEEAKAWTPRKEDYVTTYLIFGIEEIHDAANTDAMMLVSVNTNDKTIKLTSLLRDTYVEIPGYYDNKLNSVYEGVYWHEKGTVAERKDLAARALVDVIERTYDVDISGYAAVNFNGFESIIDTLGGIDIKLGEIEANYLNTTNYISKEEYRTVKPGMNHLNGNQTLGFVRIRKKPTWDGVTSDFGRTLRQRRVISAIIDQYKNTSLTNMITVMQKCLNQVFSNITEDQLTDLLYNVVENKIFTICQNRLPMSELYHEVKEEGVFNGSRNITWTLDIRNYRDEIIKRFHQDIFNDQ